MFVATKRMYEYAGSEEMIFSIVTIVFYLVIPGLIGYVFWFAKKHKPKAWEVLAILATTVFWVLALIFGVGAFSGLVLDSRKLYAISMAALTVSLTIYGEMFNSFPGDTDDVKIARTKIKSAIGIIRSLLIFLFTYGYFYA